MTLTKVKYAEPEYNYRKPKWPEDIDHIIKALARLGYEISHNSARMAWEDYSQTMCAGWISIDNLTDETIWSNVEPFLEVYQ